MTKSATNRYQSISINLSIVIENRYQSITTRNFAIDWSLIININRLIDIDWYRLISSVIDYRFHRLDTPGGSRTEFIFNFHSSGHSIIGHYFSCACLFGNKWLTKDNEDRFCSTFNQLVVFTRLLHCTYCILKYF